MQNTYPAASTIIERARGLRSEHGENPEYDRALVELVCDLTGVPMDDKAEVAVLIGVTGPSLDALS